MFKYTKRLLSDIRFWCQEFKLQSKENDELDRISDITFQEGYGGHNTMAGFGYYKEMQRNRAERKRLHEKQFAAIQHIRCAHAQKSVNLLNTLKLRTK